MKNDSVTLLGVRGSVPVSGAEFARYGGATTCVLVRLQGQYLILDAGSGLMRLPEAAAREPSLPLILTHAHADHLLGLPLCPYLYRADASLDIYGVTRGAWSVRAQVERLLSPPLWPVGPEALPAVLRWHEQPESMRLGPLTVERKEGRHPGGVSLVRVTGGGKSVVFATDVTLPGTFPPELLEFARGCDLLLCDGQYADEQWDACADFGHSTWRMAAHFAAACGAKKLRVIHHDPMRTDDALDALEREITQIFPNGAFGREGEEVFL